MKEKTDRAQFIYKIEFDKDDHRVTKYYHKERPVKRRYKKEIDNNPVISFYQDGKWIGLDWVPKDDRRTEISTA